MQEAREAAIIAAHLRNISAEYGLTEENGDNPFGSDRERRQAAEDAAHRWTVPGQTLRRIEGSERVPGNQRKLEPMEREPLETTRKYEEGETMRHNDESHKTRRSRRASQVERRNRTASGEKQHRQEKPC